MMEIKSTGGDSGMLRDSFTDLVLIFLHILVVHRNLLIFVRDLFILPLRMHLQFHFLKGCCGLAVGMRSLAGSFEGAFWYKHEK